MAAKLVQAFGAGVFEVIEREPARLREIPGIGRGLAERIAAAWRDQRAVRDIMLFLHSHGLSPLRAARIFEAYGARAIQLVSTNPYRLAQEIRGIGFTSADQLAERLGIPRDSPFRLRAGLGHVLEEALGQGHSGLPRAELTLRASELLGVEAEALEEVLAGEVAAGALILDPVEGTPCLFLPWVHQAERAIAAGLRRLAGGRPPWQIDDADARVEAVERTLALRLAEGQRTALRMALTTKLGIITGGPGTGKTTLVEAILAGLARTGVEVQLAAPTGRAARGSARAPGAMPRPCTACSRPSPGAASGAAPSGP